uniref:Uncharacterized protein n=1 Tax=Arundo donax TaxID=35708 RepID=A0A0A9GZE3_ARUDO
MTKSMSSFSPTTPIYMYTQKTCRSQFSSIRDYWECHITNIDILASTLMTFDGPLNMFSFIVRVR